MQTDLSCDRSLTWRGRFLRRQNPAHWCSCQGMRADVEGEVDVGEPFAPQAALGAASNRSACQWRDRHD